MAELHDLPRPEGAHRDRIRKGRGPGSGKGKTAGRGHKGQKARSGGGGPGGGKPYFEGGQLPLQRRIPKRGFTPRNRRVFQTVNLYQLEAAEEGDFTPQTFVDLGWIRDVNAPIKILGTGELTRKVSVSAHAFSKSAREKIEGQGGQAEELK